MGRKEISGSNVALRMQEIKILACESAPGKLPVLRICDANVAMRIAAVIAEWVTKNIVWYGNIISWDT